MVARGSWPKVSNVVGETPAQGGLGLASYTNCSDGKGQKYRRRRPTTGFYNGISYSNRTTASADVEAVDPGGIESALSGDSRAWWRTYPQEWMPLSILDDCSRDVLALEAPSGTTTGPARQTLKQVFREQEMPRFQQLHRGKRQRYYTSTYTCLVTTSFTLLGLTILLLSASGG